MFVGRSVKAMALDRLLEGAHIIAFPSDAPSHRTRCERGPGPLPKPHHRFLPRPKGGLFAWSTVRNYPHVILAAGLFDVAVLGQAGFVNTSCAFGVHLTDTQLSQLSDRLDRTVSIAFDSDLAGQNAAGTLAQSLQALQAGLCRGRWVLIGETGKWRTGHSFYRLWFAETIG